jgi:large subunit ribosomal protein L15
MRINELKKIPGKQGQRHRKGRGASTGNGKTAGRGQKGQKARAGGYHRVGFEGGQMPLQRRLPKSGFKNKSRKSYLCVNISRLPKYESDSVLTHDEILKKMSARNSIGSRVRVKLLGVGELHRPLKIEVYKASSSAMRKVGESGGVVLLK